MQRADRQRHEDAAARDRGPRDLGEMLRREAFDDDVGALGERRQVDERRACERKPASARCALSRSRTGNGGERQTRHVARIDAPRHGKADRAESGDSPAASPWLEAIATPPVARATRGVRISAD